MDRDFNKEKLDIGSLDVVSGGATVDVFSEAMCCKPEGSFEVLESKQRAWKSEGCPLKCKYCWNLKYEDGFYCDV